MKAKNKKEMICYESDASRIIGTFEKVYFPENTAEVSSIVKNSRFDIVARGAGTGLAGGAVPQDSIVVDMSKMNKIISFNPGKKTINIEPGITLKELNEKLLSVGLEFPIDPSNNGISSIGGMIAANCSGQRAMRYGNIKDWIDEIDFVNGKGELVRIGKADLGDVCGMEGITGIITGAKLKLAPILNRSASLFQSDNLNQALSIARRLRAEKEVVILDLFSPFVSKLLGFPEKYNLIIEFNSDRGKIKGKEFEDIEAIRKNAISKVFSEGYYNIEDPKLFFDKIQEFSVLLEEMKIPYIAYPGTGIINAFFKDSEKNKRDALVEYMLKSKAILGRFGIGLLRKKFVEPFQVKLIQRVKQRHDPFGKINRGKLIDINVNRPIIIKERNGKEISGEEITAMEVESEIDDECDVIVEELKEDLSEDNGKTNSNLKVGEIAPQSTVFPSSPNPRYKSEGFGDKQEILLPEEKTADSAEENSEEKNTCDFSEKEIQQRIEDYKETFQSELGNDKMHEVEEIARNIPRDIAKKETDYKSIQDIMTGKSRGFQKTNDSGKMPNKDNEVKNDN